jgi:hypothetical protein
MHSPLDNPVWQALNSLQHYFNIGTPQVKYFPENVSPFVGMEQWDSRDITILEEQLPLDRSFSVMIARDVMLPEIFEIIFTCPLYQMVCSKPLAAPKKNQPIRLLGENDVPQMLAITAKTKPGPFYGQTYTMGNYYGIFQEEKLVSMAGERLQLPGYTEVSAICTDPEYLGNGYALLLTDFLARRILNEGNIPFLHVKTDNLRAIEVYRRAGFEIRTEVFFAVFRKKVGVR